MKYIKCLTICLLMALVASCDKKDVEFPMHPVDTATEASLQVVYTAPLKAITANYMYYVDINGVEYSNNGSTFLATYNFIPSGAVARYYTVKAGDVDLVFKGADGSVKYQGKVTGLQAGKKYIAFVYDLAKDPILSEDLEIPMFPGTAETATHCSVKVYNFMYEADGVPTTDKIQYALLKTDKDAVAAAEKIQDKYELVGKPVGFGECTGYFNPKIEKTVFNSQGYQRRDLTLFLTDDAGELKLDENGNAIQLKYTKTNGTEAVFTDYWTWYIGRAYFEIIRGVRSSKTITMAITQFTAL